MKNLAKLFFIITFLFWMLPGQSWAASLCHTLEVELPFIGKSVCGPAAYLVGAYQLAVGVAILLVAIMIVVGGVQWIASGDNPGKIKEAKGRIFGAITGLIILLLSYLILRFIGGDSFVNLKNWERLPSSSDIELGNFGGSGASGGGASSGF